jgi:sulfotransferase family protein
MVSPRNRPILVTGSHRSGTTWVGKMIACHPRVMYFSEPFNPQYHPLPISNWWHRITDADQELFRAYLRPSAELRYPWLRQLPNEPLPGSKRVLRALRYLRRRWLGYRPLLKDPIALLSAEWLAQEYPTQVIVLIRHPASFASSIKRLGWLFPAAHLLRQESVMRDWLHPYEAELRRLLRGPADILDHAIVAWRVLHHVIRIYQERHSDWLFCRHEDLSLAPVDRFGQVFQFLGLAFTPEIRAAVEQHSSDDNPREAGGEIHKLKRNSKANIWNWQERLTPGEIDRVRRQTEELADYFYGDQDWWSKRILAAA